MNKTLLLIICDFLLLNLLALTRWEKVNNAPLNPPKTTVTSTPEPGKNQPSTGNPDIVATLKLSLEQEQQQRQQLHSQLENVQSQLQSKSETLAQREARLKAAQQSLAEQQKQAESLASQKAQVAQQAEQAQQRAEALAGQLSQSNAQVEQTREQSKKLQEELAKQKAEAEKLSKSVSDLEKQRQEAQDKIQTLNTKVQVSQAETTFLRGNVQNLQQQVTAEREEKQKLQEQTGKLAEGVTQLAENSASLRKEIRSNTPINANALYNQFLENRISATFNAVRTNIFGPTTKNATTQTILVSDGDKVYAIMHINDTATTLGEAGADWQTIQGSLNRDGTTVPIKSLTFLSLDPRICVVPLDLDTARSLKAKIYPTAIDPFKFPQAVLVNGAGGYYGEVDFKLDSSTPGYVKMKTKIFSHLFGEFSPSTGDLVFSKTGELLGIMVNNQYCALVDNFLPAGKITFGSKVPTAQVKKEFGQMRDRVLRLPQRLQ